MEGARTWGSGSRLLFYDIMNSSHEPWYIQGEITPACDDIRYHTEQSSRSHEFSYQTIPSYQWYQFDSEEHSESHNINPFSSTAVLIPAYNEGQIISSVVTEARKIVQRVIVIDDGSSDNTADQATKAGADVIRLHKNQGKAGAVLIGCSYAKKNGIETIILLDGDGQHNPREIPVVAAPVMAGVADMVIGSRFMGEKNQIPRYRIAGQQVLNGVTRLASRIPITDSQSGFRVLGKRALDNLNFKSKGYNLESDMITHFALIGIRMVEVPITVRYDVPNKHKMNPLRHGAGIISHLLFDITRNSRILSKIPSMTTLIFGAAIFFAFLSGFLFRPFIEIHLLSIGLFTMIMGSHGILYQLIRRK